MKPEEKENTELLEVPHGQAESPPFEDVKPNPATGYLCSNGPASSSKGIGQFDEVGDPMGYAAEKLSSPFENTNGGPDLNLLNHAGNMESENGPVEFHSEKCSVEDLYIPCVLLDPTENPLMTDSIYMQFGRSRSGSFEQIGLESRSTSDWDLASIVDSVEFQKETMTPLRGTDAN